MGEIKLESGLMENKKNVGVERIVSELNKQPLRSTESTVLHSRQITVVVDAECRILPDGVRIVVNGNGGDHYKNFVSEDLVAFLDESATKVKDKIEELKDKDDVALIEKTEGIIEKIKAK